jgi:TonB family protein
MTRAAALAVALSLPLAARAQSNPDAGAPSPDAQAAASDAGTGGDAAGPSPAGAGTTSAGADGGAAPVFERPRLLSDSVVPPPPNAPAITSKVVVTVKLLVDATGAVQKVELKTPPQPPFDDAVVAAVKAFKFQPGRYAGAPVPVAITFTNTFLPLPPPPVPEAAIKDEGPVRTSVLRGRLIELGTRAPISGATVTAVVGDRHYSVEADLRGKFRLALPPGNAKVSVYAPSHNPFVQDETLAPKQELAVKYLIERDRYDPYEFTAVAERTRRDEVSRITLRGAEIKQIPGTFGDPFRVIQTLPGVASVVSLLPYPVVRGASPSSTGFLLDGTRVPLLYHLLLGTSVVHPEFIDEIQFYPGGAPAPYGGYTGGIIDGRTARARPDEHLLDFDANFLETGGFVREPIKPIGATFTAAARYGYPGLLLSLATDRLTLSYWDYQLRLDGGTPRNGWTVFFFGANDELDTVAATADPNAPNPPLTPTLVLGFHRGDFRYRHADGGLEENLRLVAGYDHTFSAGTDFHVWSAEPTASVRWTPTKELTFDAGVQAFFHKVDQGAGSVAGQNAFSALTAQLDKFYGASPYLEALWRPTPRILIRPGVRADTMSDGTTTKSDIDPRLTVRYKLADRDLPEASHGSDDSAIWLKGSAGIYHQPPRFVLPLPGLDMMPLKYGLLRSYQTSLGVEIPLEQRFQFNVEGFFNYMDPTIFDLQLNDTSVITAPNSGLVPTTIVNPQNRGQMFIDRLTQPETGRAYGGEVLIRRQSKSGVFGWVSYTLSRSERYRSEQYTDASGQTQTHMVWRAYDFDRTHLINVVAGLPLRRNWDIGMRWQYQSGAPVPVTSGYNNARKDGYLRLDVRVDKRAVYRKWLLDFYVDITNIAVLPEEVQPGTVIRYVLPTVGLRGRL